MPRTDVDVANLKGKALNAFFVKPENKGKYPGYSTLSADGKRQYIVTGEKPNEVPKEGSARDLKAKLKAKGIKGYSKLRKKQLEKAVETGVCPKFVPNPDTVDYFRALLKKHNVAGRSKAKSRAALQDLLAANNIEEDESL